MNSNGVDALGLDEAALRAQYRQMVADRAAGRTRYIPPARPVTRQCNPVRHASDRLLPWSTVEPVTGEKPQEQACYTPRHAAQPVPARRDDDELTTFTLNHSAGW